jgi:hypothetical protein
MSACQLPTAKDLRFHNLRALFLAAAPFLGGSSALHDALRLHFSTPTGPEDLSLYRLLDTLADPTKLAIITAEDITEDEQLIRIIGIWLAVGRCEPNPFIDD